MVTRVLNNGVMSLSLGFPSASPTKPFFRPLSSYRCCYKGDGNNIDDWYENDFPKLCSEARLDKKINGNCKGLKPEKVVLYQHRFCPLARQVGVFLEYYQVHHELVRVTPVTMDEISWSYHKSLPMFVVDDQYDQPMLDSSEFINKLFKEMVDPNYDPNADEEEKKWREWVDNYVVHVVSAIAYGTFAKAVESFSYLVLDVGDAYVGGGWVDTLPLRLKRMQAMYAGAAEKYDLTMKLMKEHSIANPRENFREAVRRWIDALKWRKFIGGCDKPGLADLAFFAAVRIVFSIEYDLVSDMLTDYPVFRTWYFAMQFRCTSFLR